MCRQVWRLVNGLLTSANAMVSTLVLVVLTLYIAACLGATWVCVSLRSLHAPETRRKNFCRSPTQEADV